MTKKNKVYSPEPQETHKKTFDINELEYYVSRDLFNINKEHVDSKINDLNNRVDSIPKFISDSLETFELKLNKKQNNNRTSFWFQMVPIIISIIAIAIAYVM